MKVIKTISVFFAAALFLTACTADQPTQVANNTPDANSTTIAEVPEGDVDGYVKDDFDLQRVGNLLERSKSPQEFETSLNKNNGINNLDLNGDGYVDYISVDEFGGEDDFERGLSFYTSYGPDRRQDLGTVYFYRDEPRYPGARVVLTGNDNIYGENNFYEANWLEKSLSIASLLFSPKREQYRSPYYFKNYPSGYTTYNVVERPYYRTRIEKLYPQPMFIYTTTTPVYFSKIKIKSPNNGLHLGQIYGRLKKPTKEQKEFYRLNPRKPGRAKGHDKDKDNKEKITKSKDDSGRGKPLKADKKNNGDNGQRGKPDNAGKPKNNKSLPNKGSDKKNDKKDQGKKSGGKKP